MAVWPICQGESTAKLQNSFLSLIKIFKVPSRTFSGRIRWPLFISRVLHFCWIKFLTVKMAFDVYLFDSFSSEKCSCPEEITTNAYSYAPYTRFIKGYNSSTGAPLYNGIFYKILTKMVKQCCGSCPSRASRETKIKWQDEAVLKAKSMSVMKKNIGKYDLSFPLEGSKTSEYYRYVYI